MSDDHPWFVKQIKDLRTIYLFGYLSSGTSYALHFRNDIERRAKEGDSACKRILDAYDQLRRSNSLNDLKPEDLIPITKESIPTIQEPVLTAYFTAMIDGEENVVNFCTYLLDSQWDYTDPASKMNKTPDEVKEFLKDSRLLKRWYLEQNIPTRNYYNMVYHAAKRWINAQPKS